MCRLVFHDDMPFRYAYWQPQTWPSRMAWFMGPTWCPSGADRTQVGPILAPWTLLSGKICGDTTSFTHNVISGRWPKNIFYRHTVLNTACTSNHTDASHLACLARRRLHFYTVALRITRQIVRASIGKIYVLDRSKYIRIMFFTTSTFVIYGHTAVNHNKHILVWFLFF